MRVLYFRGRLRDEPRLADPGLAVHQQHRGTAFGGTSERALQGQALIGATHQRSRPARVGAHAFRVRSHRAACQGPCGLVLPTVCRRSAESTALPADGYTATVVPLAGHRVPHPAVGACSNLTAAMGLAQNPGTSVVT
jgi:hypothetical protein